jgi:hypothetical protein
MCQVACCLLSWLIWLLVESVVLHLVSARAYCQYKFDRACPARKNQGDGSGKPAFKTRRYGYAFKAWWLLNRMGQFSLRLVLNAFGEQGDLLKCNQIFCNVTLQVENFTNNKPATCEGYIMLRW